MEDNNTTNEIVDTENRQCTKNFRRSYSMKTKQFAIKLITDSQDKVKHPIVHASKELTIPVRTLRKWWSDAEGILAMDENKKTLHEGRKRKHQEEEIHAVQFIRNKRELRKPAISALDVAKEILARFPTEFGNLDKCRSWVYRILDRNNFSIRRKTNEGSSKLSEEEMGQIHLDFVMHFKYLMDIHKFDLHNVINMDETGCYFDMPSNTTIAEKGSKTVRIDSTTNSNHCTVFLSVALDGSKLKPLVVWKAKPDGTVFSRLNQLDSRNAYCCQEKGWCNENVMAVWVDQCLKDYLKDISSPTLLMMDNFSAHQTSATRNLISNLGTSMLMPPPNMTSKVQILDVGINKPFKDYMRSLYNDFLLNNPTDKVTKVLISKWIADSWEKIPEEFVINTAHRIGFINKNE